MFGKCIFSEFLSDMWTVLPPFPHINVENCYFCVAQGSAVKIINIANGGRGKKTGNEGKNVFQNIFAHDCLNFSWSRNSGLLVLWGFDKLLTDFYQLYMNILMYLFKFLMKIGVGWGGGGRYDKVRSWNHFCTLV